MNRLKKFLRQSALILMILLAAFGMGFSMNLNRREKYMDREIKIEQSEVKEDESESELKELKDEIT